MPNCTQNEFGFRSFDRRKIEANFSGGDVSSDGGVLLLRAAEQRLGLIKALSAALPDPSDQALISHTQEELLRQRIFGLAAGYEDLNDHDALRHDLVWQTAVERSAAIGLQPHPVPARTAPRLQGPFRDAQGDRGPVHRVVCGSARRVDPRFRRCVEVTAEGDRSRG
jgi:hypothetical protein